VNAPGRRLPTARALATGLLAALALGLLLSLSALGDVRRRSAARTWCS
jgi:hypothetical protein